MKFRIAILVLLLLSQIVCGQNVSHLVASYASGKISLTFDLQTFGPADITLRYSSDKGATWLPCRTVSGNLHSQATGSKTVVWNCAADDVVNGSFIFKVEAVCFVNLVPVEGGIFMMGCSPEQGNDCNNDERPLHRATVYDFYIANTEVTQALWKSVMGSNPSYWQGDSLPVERVSWFDIQSFLIRLNAKTGMKFRLPTEAEWEYAARGGLLARGFKYSGSNDPDEVAWYIDNSNGRTHPVAQKKPNELGLYDMSGNVYEWCSDWYKGPYSSPNISPAARLYRVYRGGSWGDYAPSLRNSFRSSYTPDLTRSYTGFRLAHSINK